MMKLTSEEKQALTLNIAGRYQEEEVSKMCQSFIDAFV